MQISFPWKHKFTGWPVLVLIALMIFFTGVKLLQVDIGPSWEDYLVGIAQGDQTIDSSKVPFLILGAGLMLISIGALLRSRLALIMTLFLLLVSALSVVLTQAHSAIFLIYCIVLGAVLITFRDLFNRSSLLASSIFTFTSVAVLLSYATFGNFYLGNEFSPPISDLVTSFYYSVVTMSTVGYGDYTPQTPQAKLFTVSVIIFGLTVFATTLTSIVAPIFNNSIRNIIGKRESKMQRKNHFIVIGNSALALNTCSELKKREHHITRILPASFEPKGLSGEFDTVYGQATRAEVLIEAGADKANAVLSMIDDDSDNAFVILAVRELSANIKTIVAVNDSQNIDKIRLTHPDIVISPQVFGGELTAMLLNDEEITSEFVMSRLFQEKS